MNEDASKHPAHPHVGTTYPRVNQRQFSVNAPNSAHERLSTSSHYRRMNAHTRRGVGTASPPTETPIYIDDEEEARS